MNATQLSQSIEELSSALTYTELVLMGVTMIIICAVTIIGNALVVISFLLDKKLRTLTNYFLLSLAISDVMIATFSMPIFTAYLLIGEWSFGSTLCNIWLAQDYVCSNASCLNLLMIAVDRYFSVTDPLRYRAKRTSKRVGIMISCVWTVAFLLWPPWIYAWPYIEGKITVPEEDCYVQFLQTNTYVTVIMAVLDYYLPVSVILVLYYKIWKETKRRSQYLANIETGYQSESICLQVPNSSSDKQKEQSSYGDDSRYSGEHDSRKHETLKVVTTSNSRFASAYENKADNQNSALETSESSLVISDHRMPCKISATQKPDSKAARVLTVILLAFIITTTPYNVLVIIKNLDPSDSIVPYSVYLFFIYLFYINSTLNPLCYALGNENFRVTYWRILTCSRNRKKSQGRYGVANCSCKSLETKTSCYSKHISSFV